MDDQAIWSNSAGCDLKILLFGSNGQVGWELQRSLAPLGELVALNRQSTAWCGDMANLAGLVKTLRLVRPDVVVNAAAYTAVDRAENEPLTAHAVNALAPALLAEEARKLGALLVHYSTDYVFDGHGHVPWLESAATGPLGVYGQTKLEGEKLIQSAWDRHLIFRTSWVYSARGGNFAKTMLRLATERETLTVINDQFGAPTGAELLADVTAHCIRHVLQRSVGTGLYHLAAAGEVTWHGYAEHVLAQARHNANFPPLVTKEITPVPSSAFKTAATRPLNSRLDTFKIQAQFNLSLPYWQHGVNRMLQEIVVH